MKNLLLLIVFTFTMNAAFAQFGIKAGVNFSNISTNQDDIENLEGNVGFQTGLLFRINVSESFAIQPEALFVRKGTQYEFLGTEVKSNMDYVDIPVMLIFKPVEFMSIQVGPQFSYLLGTNVTYGDGFAGIGEGYEAEREDFEDVDYGLAVGVGFNVGKAIIDLRYTRGFKKYEKETNIGNITIEPSSNHYGLQASVGVMF